MEQGGTGACCRHERSSNYVVTISLCIQPEEDSKSFSFTEVVAHMSERGNHVMSNSLSSLTKTLLVPPFRETMP